MSPSDVSEHEFDADEAAGAGGQWWGDAFHMTPGDLHVKHFHEPNDRDYDS
jgi:oxalate decarboxylase/phosphoglucose isomerase-like protein (cupin superfamily)